MPRKRVGSEQPIDRETAIRDYVKERLVAPDGLASNIREIGTAVRAMLDSDLKWSTIITLISVSSKVPKKTVQKVLSAAMHLDRDYLKQEGEDE